MLVPSAVQELEKESATVKVSNLLADSSAAFLKKVFAECGTIESVKFRAPASNSSLQSKKAFVKFSDKEAADKAIAMNGTLVEDRHLQVSVLFPEPDFDCSLFVTNLTEKVNEEKLWKTFEKFGPVKSVDLALTGQGKWFATVTFGNKEARRLATKDHIQLDGVVLKVCRRHSPEKREAKRKEKVQKLQEQAAVAQEEFYNHPIIGEDWDLMAPGENLDVDFKNVRTYTSKRIHKQWMEEIMGKRKPKLTKEKGFVAAEAREVKRKKRADREQKEKDNKIKVNRIKIRIKKI